jgi:hypothetical protein
MPLKNRCTRAGVLSLSTTFHSDLVKSSFSGFLVIERLIELRNTDSSFAIPTTAGVALTCFNRLPDVRLVYQPQSQQGLLPEWTTPSSMSTQEKDFFFPFCNRSTSSMNKQATSQMTHAEQEAETEANRLIEQIEAALAAVVMRSAEESDSLDAAADRIERAARDFVDALRELAHERKPTSEGT